MRGLRGKVSKNLIIFVLASFALMSILGMNIGMEINDGEMSPCPFMAGQATMCQMSVTEHIARWRETVLGIPKGDFPSLAILLLAVVLIPFAKLFSKPEELTKFAARLFVYQKMHIVKLFDPLLLAFSDGILHPRIYEFATL